MRPAEWERMESDRFRGAMFACGFIGFLQVALGLTGWHVGWLAPAIITLTIITAHAIVRWDIRRAWLRSDGRAYTTEHGFPIWLDTHAPGLHVSIGSSNIRAHHKVWIQVSGDGGGAELELDDGFAERISDALACYIEATRKGMP